MAGLRGKEGTYCTENDRGHISALVVDQSDERTLRPFPCRSFTFPNLGILREAEGLKRDDAE